MGVSIPIGVIHCGRKFIQRQQQTLMGGGFNIGGAHGNNCGHHIGGNRGGGRQGFEHTAGACLRLEADVDAHTGVFGHKGLEPGQEGFGGWFRPVGVKFWREPERQRDGAIGSRRAGGLRRGCDGQVWRWGGCDRVKRRRGCRCWPPIDTASQENDQS